MSKISTSADTIAKEINTLIAHKRMGYKEIYETLLAKSVIEPGTETEFKKLYEFLLSNEYIDKTRIKQWNKKSGKLPKYFTKKQLVKLFDCIDRPKDGVACFLALMGGLRVREICRLQIEDIDFEQHKIFIRDSKNTNRARDGYGTDRIVHFDSSIDNVLKRWIEIIGKESKWFLPSDKSPDTYLRPKSLHERFRGYLKQANLLQVDYTLTIKQKNHGKTKEFKVNRYKFHFHCLRHTMACVIYNKTGDIYLVNRFLGHKQLDTTMVYAKITDSKMSSALNDVFSSLHYDGVQSPVQSNQLPVRNVQSFQQEDPLIEEKKKIISQMTAGEITKEECQQKLNDLQEFESYV
jgi:integrase